MKILIFCPYYPPHIGGLESHADEFNKYLSQTGIDILVFTPCLPKDAKTHEFIHSKEVEIIRFPAFEIISGYFLPRCWSIKFWKLFLSLFKNKYDIIISRTRFFNTSLLALICAKIKRTKWIHIEHGSDFVQLSNKFKSSIAKLYDYTFGWLVFNCSDLNISISYTVQKFVHKFNKRNSPVIYRGIKLEEIDAAEPNYNLKEKYKNKIIITFAGRLYKWKGVKNTVQAINSLPIKFKKRLVFLIIGDGEDYQKISRFIAKDSPVEMLGNIPRKKVISILKSSDIYVHSAFPGGGLSTSLLEAMYCKNAIIASPYEGAKEVIENKVNGILLKNNSPKFIKKEIVILLSHLDLISKYSQKSYFDIKNSFNWNKPIKKYEEIFEALLRDK